MKEKIKNVLNKKLQEVHSELEELKQKNDTCGRRVDLQDDIYNIEKAVRNLNTQNENYFLDIITKELIKNPFGFK